MGDGWIEELRFQEQGLIPAVVQDVKTGKVLMLGYMNKEALELTAKTRTVHFWSRSRKKLWCKGETSGHVQRVVELRVDCDGDAILAVVEQKVGACHTGHYSCFYRSLSGLKWVETEERVFDPDEVYERTENRSD